MEHPSSFRDPNGAVYCHNGSVYRQINLLYKENYLQLINSGLYSALCKDKLIIQHEAVENRHAGPDNIYKIIKPDLIPFISYPYEWCFSQLRDSALTTLKIQKTALDFGMTLKDCSAYNIQFKDGRPIFIDTLSFERYSPGQPWVAYKQFCQHFLAPLALMGLNDARLSQLLRVHIDGIPLDLASRLLPARTYFNLSIFIHIHLHAKIQRRFAHKQLVKRNYGFGKNSFLGLIESLEAAIKKIRYGAAGTEWSDYYEDNSYSAESFQDKVQLVDKFLEEVRPKGVYDFGANTGVFSRLAANKGVPCISFDVDPAAVEKNYLETVKHNEANILPLLLDITNPSPSIGWENIERASMIERMRTDMALALALVHHLAISNNIPLKKIADFFFKICDYLIIEFIPKSDSQVQKLLSARNDIFSSYTKKDFETEFLRCFSIKYSVDIKGSQRTLYLMKRNISHG